ncbi:Nuclear pore complex protein [Ceratobasidium theobromae]|uniref:Nuclear pore complex protein n=1 Tax=Ceratobasidium theobromae TaxID=1582974 RepID=A0A5N5QE32_9AGAM|nr:Nuclear pore complex protein [Ceratobasidium theobromae]
MDVEYWENLDTFLANVFREPTPHLEQELYYRLEDAKPRFLSLLDVPPRSSAEETELKSGKATIGGQQKTYNNDFVQEALFLAAQLDCSERLAAGILDQVLSGYPNDDPVGSTIKAAQRFYSGRQHVLTTLQLVLNSAMGISAIHPAVQSKVADYIIALVGTTTTLSGGKQGTLGEKIIQQIDTCATLIQKHQASQRNADSTTVIGANGVYKFAAERYGEIVSALQNERRCLSHLLFVLAGSGELGANEVVRMVSWMAAISPDDPSMIHVLAACLAGLDATTPLGSDTAFVGQLKAEFAKPNWRVPEVKAVLTIRWCLFLIEASNGNRSFEAAHGYSESDIERLVTDAVRADALRFLAMLLHFSRPLNQASLDTLGLDELSSPDWQLASRLEPLAASIDSDFYRFLLRQVDLLVIAFVTSLSPVLRRMRHADEDTGHSLTLSTSRARQPDPRATSHANHQQPSRSGLADFFDLIAFIYADQTPDEALKWWADSSDTRLYAFLRWAAEARVPSLLKPLYNMFGSLARGPGCATFAYNFFSSNGGQYRGNAVTAGTGWCSWASLFGSLDWLLSSVPDQRTQTQARQTGPTGGALMDIGANNRQPLPVDPEEIRSIMAFLRVLRVVARYSTPARAALLENGQYRAVAVMLDLVRAHVALELKGKLFDTLAAFCETGDEAGVGTEIVKLMWGSLERYEVLPVRNASALDTPAGWKKSRGVPAELEEVEAPARQYPATLAFLHLLNSLVRTPEAVPDNLGSGHRVAGTGPYVRFVLDDVLLKIEQREYADPADRWRLTEACLEFIEYSLVGYDLGSLVAGEWASTNPGVRAEQTAIVQRMVQHPGFGVLLRVLADERVRDVLLGIIGVTNLSDGAQNQLQGGESHFVKCLLKVLRIITRALAIQDAFIELLVPAARQLSLDVDLPTVVPTCDQMLLWRPDAVVQIASLVNYRYSQEVVLLSVRLMTTLSRSSCFNTMETTTYFSRRVSRLLGMLGRDQPDVIVQGYASQLGIDTQEELCADDDDTPENQDTADQALILSRQVRSAIIEFLLVNTTITAPSPNFAHLLLGFDVANAPMGSGAAMAIQDPRAGGGRESCLHVVLDMLSEGIPKLDRRSRRQSHVDQRRPLFERHPVLAEKCYRLIHQLCTHALTFGTTIRYLRTNEDFFARQLAAIPLRPLAHHSPDGAVRLGDNSVVPTSCMALTAFLRLRSWVLDLVSLELHIMTGVEQDPRASRILGLLFQKPTTDSSSALTVFEEAMNIPAPGQALMRVLELLESLAFHWADAKSVEPVELRLFSDLNFDSCLRPDATGCYIVDADALLTLLTQQRRHLQRQGFLPTPEHHTQLKTETRYLLECCALENNRRQIAHSRAAAYESWTRLCNVALTRCFDTLPDDSREVILFDVVQALPPVIFGAEPETAVLLCESLLALIAKLRDDRHHQVVLQSIVDDPLAATLPAERLNGLLSSIMDCTLQPGTSERQRGNLYSAMVHYIQLAFSAEERAAEKASLGQSTNGPKLLSQSFAMSANGSNDKDIVLFGSNPSSKRAIKGSGLEASTLSVLNKYVDRLVPLVCRDAIDGSDVWKTIAFTFLESLVRVSRMEKAHRVLNIMSRQGFLQHFVQSVGESEDQLLAVLKPDPESLNALYVYEAKMSLLIKIAQTRQGADRLQDARVLSVLAQCDFLNARPEKDIDFRNFESFLPSAVERYHQILVPALELATSVISTIGSDSPNVAKQALNFILTHRETCLMLFTNEEAYLPLASVQELHLFVALCALVAPYVEWRDLNDARSFGQVHAAVLELAARILSQGGWRMNVIPTTESEQLDAKRPAKGISYSNMTVFDQRARNATNYLQKWVLVYLSAIGERSIGTNEPFHPVLTAVASTAREPAAIATGKPYLADAIAALRSSVNRLSSLLVELKEMPMQTGKLGIDEVDEIVQAAQVSFLGELDIPQRRALASRELARAAQGYRNDVRSTLHTTEILLLLLWRHLRHFLSSNSPSAEDAGSFMRSVSAPLRRPAVLEHLRADAEIAIREITLELDEIEVPRDVLGATADAGARESYVRVLTRMLRGVTALGGQDMDEDDD